MFWVTFAIYIEFGSAILEYVAENPVYMTEDVDDAENGETVSSGKSRRLSKIQRMQRWLAIVIQSRCRGIRARRYVQEKPAIDAATKVIPQNTIRTIVMAISLHGMHTSEENTGKCLCPIFPNNLLLHLDPSYPAWENGLRANPE